MSKQTVSKCQVCGGKIVFHDSRIAADVMWGHSDKPLSETAGHDALPDPAATEAIEVKN